jgi:hypothetical protein
LIKRVWAKFDGMELACVCDPSNRKCKDDEDCTEYVVKFMEIEREDKLKEAVRHLDQDTKKFKRGMKKFESELSKSIKEMKKFKI